MAKSWSGFLPQNELAKLYWEALELSQSEKFRFRKSFLPATGEGEPESADEDTEPFVMPVVIP